jgi:murein DD-endopeptidase MepM/ murein hydrolase activator NlpD
VTTYVVQPGETLLAIARKLNVPLAKLLELNDLPDPNRLVAGQSLRVPASTAETLSSTVAATPTPTATLRPVLSATPTASPRPPLATPGSATATPVPRGEKIPNAPAFVWPAQGPITQYFGENGHGGIDIERPLGSTVRAAFDGMVIAAVKGNDGRGWYIDIDHGNGWLTEYQHLGKLSVSAGERVTRGQPIGEVGMTGLSTGPHLHFEIHKDGRRLDPLRYLP